MNNDDIRAYVLNFAQRLAAGVVYTEPLVKEEKQGHSIVAAILEESVQSAEIMGKLAARLLSRAVGLQNVIHNLKAQMAEEESGDQAAEATVDPKETASEEPIGKPDGDPQVAEQETQA